MIEQNRTRYIVHCDSCPEVEEFEKAYLDGWRGLIEEIKAGGWRLTKLGDEWLHACPSCKDDRRHEDRRR